MVNEKDLEKVAMLDSIQNQACHVISSEALKTCPYHAIVSKAKETINDEVSADIANELGLLPRNNLKCPERKDKKR